MENSLYFHTRLLIAIFMMTLSICSAYAADDKAYEIGESLQKEKVVKEPLNVSYKNLDWEALSPADWDPLEALKGLDLDKLDDADPKAIEALIAVGEAWKNAPVNPALSGQRVRMSGFVVPLDISKVKVKEFLLVPYFGACIHVPPPPSNQAVHAVNTQVDNKQQNEHLKNAALIQGPITIIGTLETISSDTSMGSAGYIVQIESIEEYKETIN
tara:strand:+ start:25770 stop:26411 length:642 start_codon:yes stop_codon:yes gene_type:complete